MWENSREVYFFVGCSLLNRIVEERVLLLQWHHASSREMVIKNRLEVGGIRSTTKVAWRGMWRNIGRDLTALTISHVIFSWFDCHSRLIRYNWLISVRGRDSGNHGLHKIKRNLISLETKLLWSRGYWIKLVVLARIFSDANAHYWLIAGDGSVRVWDIDWFFVAKLNFSLWIFVSIYLFIPNSKECWFSL